MGKLRLKTLKSPLAVLKPRLRMLIPSLASETSPASETRSWRYGKTSSASRGYGHAWRLARERFLGQQPLCRSCEKDGRLTLAKVVDHIQPHRGDQELFWDETNWQPLCKPCHDRKTNLEMAADGGRGLHELQTSAT